MKRTLTTLALLFGLCASAQAALVYSFTSSAAEFKFAAPVLLIDSATLPAGDLFDVVNHMAGETLGSVEFWQPQFALSAIALNFFGGGPLDSIIYSFTGPFSHLGTYNSYGLAGPNGASLTITDTVLAVPEPGSLLLLGTALGALSFMRRRQRG